MENSPSISTILVPTDGSAEAEKAAALAGELAGLYRARVILLHCLDDIIENGTPKHMQRLADIDHLSIGDVLTAAGEETLKRAETVLRQQGVERIQCVMPSGDPVRVIVDCAETHGVDLIVMGSRGADGIKGFLNGSVSYRVRRRVTCSCATVH